MVGRCCQLEIRENIALTTGIDVPPGAGNDPMAQQEAMEEAIVQIADGLARIELAQQQDNLLLAHSVAGELVPVACQLGLTLLARVAGDLADCAEFGDMVSFHAVATRLSRVGEGSLAAVIDRVVSNG